MESPLFRRVLVVDDEPGIISAVRRELCTPPLGRYRYEVEGFPDAAQALARAAQEDFDAVISDYRMPAMSGLEFLKALAAAQPDCARLVLSGQTDMAALVKMINETHVFRFIPKPWHDYFLKSSVAQAIDFAGTLRENRRLAGFVRGRGIAVPPLADAPDEILIVDADRAGAEALTASLTTRSDTDELYAAIRAEVAHEPGGTLEVGKDRVCVAASGKEALRLAATKTFSCVLADFKLPDMGAIELLQRIADSQPDCARVLLGAHIAQDDLIAAVDVAHIFGFVARPWQDYELKACVAQALAHRRMAIENRLLADMVRKAGGTAA